MNWRFFFGADLMMVYMIMFCHIVMHIEARSKPWDSDNIAVPTLCLRCSYAAQE